MTARLPITVRLKPDDHATLCDMANADDIDVSQLARMLLLRGLRAQRLEAER